RQRQPAAGSSIPGSAVFRGTQPGGDTAGNARIPRRRAAARPIPHAEAGPSPLRHATMQGSRIPRSVFRGPGDVRWPMRDAWQGRGFGQVRDARQVRDAWQVRGVGGYAVPGGYAIRATDTGASRPETDD